MYLLAFATKVAAVSAIVVGSQDTALVLHERRGISHNLGRSDQAAGDSVTSFKIALKQTGLDEGYDLLIDISDPQSAQYGKLWTSQQVTNTFRPLPGASATVSSWLAASDIEGAVESKGWLHFETTIRKAEALLNTTYYEYQDTRSGSLRIGCDKYYMPSHVSDLVDFVKPGIALSAPLRKRNYRRQDWDEAGKHGRPHHSWPGHAPNHTQPGATHLPPELQTCARNITPACLRALYDIPTTDSAQAYSNPSPSASLGIFQLDQYYNQSDLNSFFTKYTSVPNGTHPIFASIDNSTLIKGSSLVSEANLDFDVAFSLIYPQNVTLYQSVDGGLGPDIRLAYGIEAFLAAIDGSYCDANETATTDCGTLEPAKVFSISYGASEFTESEAEQKRQCNEIMKLSLQGHTFVVASSDYGVASGPSSSRQFNTNGCIDPKNITDVASIDYTTNGTVFNPSYPANCPYVVLSVGGTQLNANDTVLDAESAMSVPEILEQAKSEGITYPAGVSFSSAGGFSNVFLRPRYQAAASVAFVQPEDPSIDHEIDHNPKYPFYTFNGTDLLAHGTNIGSNGGLYNRIGRGFPDVSANGKNFALFDLGVAGPEYGTSIAAPIWASILTLINESRIAAGKGPVGFVNPALYRNPHIFHDIVNGSNPGCFTDGFSAVPGWDPITGLGTPDFPKLLDLFMSLP